MTNKVKITIGVAVIALVVTGVYLGFFNTGLKGQISRIPSQNGVAPLDQFKQFEILETGKCKEENLFSTFPSPSGKYKNFPSFYEILKKELADPVNVANCEYVILATSEKSTHSVIMHCTDKDMLLLDKKGKYVSFHCFSKTSDGLADIQYGTEVDGDKETNMKTSGRYTKNYEGFTESMIIQNIAITRKNKN